MNWGDCYFNHYSRLFGSPKTRTAFESSAGGPQVQVLGFDGVFGGGARVLCTLGVTHYAATVGRVVELMLAVDDAFEESQEALANACFFAADRKMHIGVGTVIGGIQNVTPAIASRWGKSAIYVTAPYNLPAGTEDVLCDAAVGKFYAAILISQAEREYVTSKGYAAFEGMLDAAGVDPINIARPSVC